MYVPEIARWVAVDPLAKKYLSKSPYTYVANIPTILYDPDGRRIEWASELSTDDIKMIKKALRHHNSSSTYKNLYRELKSDRTARYVITAGELKSTDPNTGDVTYSPAGATFEANWVQTNSQERESGNGVETWNFQNPATKDIFGQNEKGGIITINTAIIDMTKASNIADVLVEEVIHAAQYENSVGSNQSATTAEGLPVTANTEFEAKTIVGKIKSESRRPLLTGSEDDIAHRFGVNAFRTRSDNGYFPAMQQWHLNAYQERRETDAQPLLLKKLIK